MDNQRSYAVPVTLGLLVLLLLVSFYIGGYFALSTTAPGPEPNSYCRIYQAEWLTVIYNPAAQAESAVTGDSVSTHWQPPP